MLEKKSKLSELKEWKSVIIILLLMMNGILASRGLSTPISEQAVIDLATEAARIEFQIQIEAYMEEEINSKFYRLQKPMCAVWITQVGSNYVLANGSTGSRMDYDTNVTLVQEWAVDNVSVGVILLDQIEWNTSVVIPASVIVEERYQDAIEYYGGYLGLSGVDVDWIDLGGDNQSAWPSGGNGVGIDHYDWTYHIFKNATATYIIDELGVIVSSGADDDVEINWAISNLPASRGKIFLGAGEYIIDSDITDYDKWNVEFCGEGANSTIIKFADGRPSYSSGIALSGNSTYYIKNWNIHDLTIDGNFTGQASAQGQWGIDLDYCEHVMLDNLIIVDIFSVDGDTSAGKGIVIDNSIDIQVTDWRITGIGLASAGVGGHACIVAEDSLFIRIHNGYANGGTTGVTFFANVNSSIVSDCYFENNSMAGLQLAYYNCHNNTGINVICVGHALTRQLFMLHHGSYPELPSTGNKVVGCSGYGSPMTGFAMGNGAFGNSIIGCIAVDCATSYYIEEATDCLIDGSTSLRSTSKGMLIVKGDDNTFSDMIFVDDAGWAIKLETDADGNNFNNFVISGGPIAGLQIVTGSNNRFVACDFGEAVNYLIDISSGSDNNVFINCDLSHATRRSRMLDAGTGNAIYDEIFLDIVSASEFTSTAPFGGKIDAATEFVIATGRIPILYSRLFNIKIYGIALEADADGMTIEVEGYGWGDNEVYTTETIAIATLNSTSTGFGINEGAYWIVTAGNDLDFSPDEDADVDDIVGGDSIMIKIIYEAASGDCIATNCTITAIVLEVTSK